MRWVVWSRTGRCGASKGSRWHQACYCARSGRTSRRWHVITSGGWSHAWAVARAERAKGGAFNSVPRTGPSPVGTRGDDAPAADCPGHATADLFGSQIQGDLIGGVAQWRIYQGAAKEFGSVAYDSSPHPHFRSRPQRTRSLPGLSLRYSWPRRPPSRMARSGGSSSCTAS